MSSHAVCARASVFGLTATGFAQNRTPNRGIVGLNHVGLSVPDFDKSVEYYTKTMGFPEAFRLSNASGQVQLVYVQVSQNTFVGLLATKSGGFQTMSQARRL